MRFRPEQHLCRQSEIRAVREQGRRFDCRAFTVWWMPRGQVPPRVIGDPSTLLPPSEIKVPRVCVIASTAAVGRAVRRNQAKRRLREVFRHQQHRVPAQCDLLLIARSGAATWPLPELERKFAEACQHLAATGTVTGAK
jgi:ribonuclease P protein component